MLTAPHRPTCTFLPRIRSVNFSHSLNYAMPCFNMGFSFFLISRKRSCVFVPQGLTPIDCTCPGVLKGEVLWPGYVWNFNESPREDQWYSCIRIYFFKKTIYVAIVWSSKFYVLSSLSLSHSHMHAQLQHPFNNTHMYTQNVKRQWRCMIMNR